VNRWHYPDTDHASSRAFPWVAEIRTVECPSCGAPPGAACVPVRDRPVPPGSYLASWVHKARGRRFRGEA
jgi:hypothetical protein